MIRFLKTWIDLGWTSQMAAVLLFLLVLFNPSAARADSVITAVTLNGGTTVTVNEGTGAAITAVVNVTVSNGSNSTNWRATSWLIGNTSSGSYICANHSNFSGAGSYNRSFTINAPLVAGTYNVYLIAKSADDCSGASSPTYVLPSAVIVVTPLPTVTSIKRQGSSVVYSNASVSWAVSFNTPVTGVDAADFSLLQLGGAAGAAISLVSGSGANWVVSATTGTSGEGTLGLNLIDNDTIQNSANVALGGAGLTNGDFSGEVYTLLPAVCTGEANILFCDDFERSNPGSVGSSNFGAWTITPGTGSDCNGTTGNTGCAGIDSDVPPFNVATNPRANPTRSMFTRWDVVSVDSPVINLAGKTGAQLSFWMRRGSDAFSEYPEDTGENYLLQYRALISGTLSWKILAQYPSGILQGQIFTPVIELPSDALHAQFQMRFYQPSGSGSNNTNGGAPGVRGYDYWHMDDVVIREVASPTYVGAFCDNFEAGSGRWSIGAEGFSSGNIGDASIGTLAYQSASHELDLRWGYVTAATFKTDLTGVTGNVSYWVRSGTNSTRNPATGEDLVVEYLNDSGAWVRLTTHVRNSTAGVVTNVSVPIPADALHPNFRLRFRKIAGSGYDKSYWHVDDVCVGNLLPTADLSLSKAGGTLVPGTNTTYTLKVTNLGPDPVSGSISIVDTLPTGLSYVGGGGGTSGWTCSAEGQVVTCRSTATLPVNAVSNPLVLTVAVGSSVTGSVTNTATVTGTANDNVPGNNTASYTSGSFVPGYVFTNKVCPDGVAIGSGASPCALVDWSSAVAGLSKSDIFITAINALGVPTKLHATNATTVGFQFALTCHDPIANAGVAASFSALATPLSFCTGNGAEPTNWSTTVNLVFPAGSPSVATSFAFNYADVGAVELYMRNAAATAQMGSSRRPDLGPNNWFVVRPAGFALTEIKPTTNPSGRCTSATTPAPSVVCANAATDSAVFVRAGEPFSATVKALTSSGAAAPNFGKEKVPESVRLVPSGVVAGMVPASPDVISGDFGAFAGGLAAGTAFSWAEVGIITLTPKIKDGNYLGAGDVVGVASGNVGRFIPDHFDTLVTQACASGGFTYSGQAFSAQVIARNLLGEATSNYNGSILFARSTTLSDAGAANFLTDNTLLATGFVAGVGTAQPKYTFASKETLPKSVTVRAQDTDGVLSGVTEGVVLVRSGRIQLQNAYGSELLSLPVALQIQYWNGGWQPNVLDTCTLIGGNNFSFSFPVGTSVRPNNLAACETALSVTGSPPGYALRLSAPGANNAGWTDISLTLNGAVAGASCTVVGAAGAPAVTMNAPWLQFNWKGAGLADPSARATFGAYKSPLIYRRENY